MKRLLVCGLSALLLSSAVACSTAPTKEVQTETLKVYYMNQTGSEDDSMLNWLQQSADSWEKKGYDIRFLPMLNTDMTTGLTLKKLLLVQIPHRI